MHTEQKDISVVFCRSLLDLLAEHGIQASAVLRGTGVDLSTVADSGFKLDVRQQDAIYENALNISGIQGLGLLHGEKIHLTHLGILGYALQSSRDVRQALKILIHYNPVSGARMDAHLRSEGSAMVLGFSNVTTPVNLRQYVIEEHLVSINRILKLMTGDRFCALDVRYDYDAPPYSSLYRKIFKCPVEFSCPSIEYRFDSKMLDLGLVFADPVMARACERKCEAILEGMSDSGSDVDEIRRVILMLPGDSRNLSSVAAEMNVSTRTVRRKLMAEQKTFRGVLDEIRLQLATDYLKNTKLTIEVISLLLGFSDASNFRQAFKKWTGVPPGSYRNSLHHTRTLSV
jgi:AraC-like DNA-binding protein